MADDPTTGISVDPLEQLTWNTPELQAYYQAYLQKHDDDLDCTDTEFDLEYLDCKQFYETSPIRGTLKDRLLKNGFDNKPPPAAEDSIEYIHPIFHQQNFIGFNDFYSDIHPALCLASKFLTEPVLVDWFVRLGYGIEVQDEDGEVQMVKGPMEDLIDIRQTIIKDIKMQAGDIKFIRLGQEEMGEAGGITYNYLPQVAQLLEEDYQRQHNGEKLFNYSWYNPFQPDTAQTVVLADYYRQEYMGYRTFFGSSDYGKNVKMRLDFEFACMLVHELAHCLAHLWTAQPNGREAKVMPGEALSESGISWECYTFGARVRRSFIEYPLLCMPHDFEYPLTGGMIPVEVYLSTEWMHQWFRKETWDHMTEQSRLKLYAYRPEQPAGLVVMKRYHGESWRERKYGEDVDGYAYYLIYHDGEMLDRDGRVLRKLPSPFSGSSLLRAYEGAWREDCEQIPGLGGEKHFYHELTLSLEKPYPLLLDYAVDGDADDEFSSFEDFGVPHVHGVCFCEVCLGSFMPFVSEPLKRFHGRERANMCATSRMKLKRGAGWRTPLPRKCPAMRSSSTKSTPTGSTRTKPPYPETLTNKSIDDFIPNTYRFITHFISAFQPHPYTAANL
jgi:hypothetical protein